MARILFLDDSFPFDGETARDRPLGGVQTATVALAEALAARGHQVTALTRGGRTVRCKGVAWEALTAGPGPAADLVVANRHPALFEVARAARRVLWLHNPAAYLRKPRFLLPLLRYRPVPVFLGRTHAGTAPGWLPLRPAQILPLGVERPFLETAPADSPPPPKAVFLSNPRRGLPWLIDLWRRAIRPAVPGAELHVFAGRQTYGDAADPALDAALGGIGALRDEGVVLRPPLAKAALATELATARALLYRGDPGETFCLVAAEARAMGVPVITAGVGALTERVADGVTGAVRPDPNAFADAAVSVLTDDSLWQSWHEGALKARQDAGWDRVAERWERTFLGESRPRT